LAKHYWNTPLLYRPPFEYAQAKRKIISGLVAIVIEHAKTKQEMAGKDKAMAAGIGLLEKNIISTSYGIDDPQARYYVSDVQQLVAWHDNPDQFKQAIDQILAVVGSPAPGSSPGRSKPSRLRDVPGDLITGLRHAWAMGKLEKILADRDSGVVKREKRAERALVRLNQDILLKTLDTQIVDANWNGITLKPGEKIEQTEGMRAARAIGAIGNADALEVLGGFTETANDKIILNTQTIVTHIDRGNIDRGSVRRPPNLIQAPIHMAQDNKETVKNPLIAALNKAIDEIKGRIVSSPTVVSSPLKPADAQASVDALRAWVKSSGSFMKGKGVYKFYFEYKSGNGETGQGYIVNVNGDADPLRGGATIFMYEIRDNVDFSSLSKDIESRFKIDSDHSTPSPELHHFTPLRDQILAAVDTGDFSSIREYTKQRIEDTSSPIGVSSAPGGIKMSNIPVISSPTSQKIEFAAIGPDFFDRLTFRIVSMKHISSLAQFASVP
jgi:hypothetical protein